MEHVLSFLWPIHKSEVKKFLPMATMLLLTIFVYNTLKALKDGLIVPAMGAEVISFVKFYFVVPSAVLLVIIYIKMANMFSFNRIYLYIGLFFASYFILFAFILYPYEHYFHPNMDTINKWISSTIKVGSFEFDMAHVKFFLLIYSKWLYVIFYVLAELWGSAMMFLLFWQFSNYIIPTEQAKRFYPMINLAGSLGTFFAGGFIKYISGIQVTMPGDAKALFTIQTLLSLLALFAMLVLLLFLYINKKVLTDERYIKEIKVQEAKQKLPVMDSLKMIFSSKYLGYIVILVLSYGIAINLLEGPWKAKARELYVDTSSYINFMGNIHQWNGALAVILSLVGVSLLKKYSWFTAAIITPVIIFITGVGFFSFVVFDNFIHTFLGTFFLVDPLLVAVMLGSIQNVLSKSTKFSLFDPTKEMTYIPIEGELKSKGKAAVDVIGARFAKSGGAFIQSMIFIIFPAATYTTVAPFLMIIFVIVALIWILDVGALNKAYLKYLNKVK